MKKLKDTSVEVHEIVYDSKGKVLGLVKIDPSQIESVKNKYGKTIYLQHIEGSEEVRFLFEGQLLFNYKV